MNDTVKGNILFGSQEKRHLYNTSVAACALQHDLEMLPAGDMTEIGKGSRCCFADQIKFGISHH